MAKKKAARKTAKKPAKKATKTAAKKATRKPAKKVAKKVAKKAAKKVAKKTTKRPAKKKWNWQEGLVGKAAKRKNPYDTMDEVEANHIRTVLAAYGHDIQQTAQALGIARSTVYRKMKRYKIK